MTCYVCRTILARAMGSAAGSVQLDVSVKPFPWPSVKFDPAAIAAAAAFNLLLVFAFLTPTRGAVATIVREKELRLREGMRILGLKVGPLDRPAPLTMQPSQIYAVLVPAMTSAIVFGCSLRIRVSLCERTGAPWA